MRTMVLAACALLAGCAASPGAPAVPGDATERGTAVEIFLEPLSEAEFRYEGIDGFDTREGLLSAGARRIGRETLEERMGDDAKPAVCADSPQPHLCAVFGEGEDALAAVFQGQADAPMATERWTVYRGGKELFSAPMNYYVEGPIPEVALIDGEPAVTFLRDLAARDPAKAGTQEQVVHDTFYRGTYLNAEYGLRQSYGPFGSAGVLGFIGEKAEGEAYVYFDGRPVYGPFARVRTTACCASPQSPMDVFDNGVLRFVAEKGSGAYLTEVELEPTR